MTATTQRASRRARITIPDLALGQQVTHDTLVSARVLRELDRADDTRFERAQMLLAAVDYDGTLTAWMLLALQSLLDEPINPRHVVTTRGREMAATGIKSLQVQVDRLREVLGPTHYRLLPTHSQDGRLCRMHVVIGNNLQWCRVDERGELAPYTAIERGVCREAEILAHADGWGGHTGGFMPGDSRKGAETNAGKRVIARLGPGREIYRLDFEDDPSTSPAPPEALASAEEKASPEDVSRLLRLTADAASGGIPDSRIKMMLVAAGAIDTTDVLAAVASLSADGAAQFEVALSAASSVAA